MVLIVGSQHRFASRTHIDKDELLGLSFVSLHRSSTVQGIKNILVGHGVDWKALKVVMVSLLALTEPLDLIQILMLCCVHQACMEWRRACGEGAWQRVECALPAGPIGRCPRPKGSRIFSYLDEKQTREVPHQMCGRQEVNSVEAIKSAVEANLGAAFVSAAAVAKEKELGNLAVLRIQDIPLSRTLQVVTDPARYCR